MVSGTSMFLLRLLGWLGLGALLALCNIDLLSSGARTRWNDRSAPFHSASLLASLVADTFLGKRTTLVSVTDCCGRYRTYRSTTDFVRVSLASVSPV